MLGGARGGGLGGKRGAEEDERARRVRQREEEDALLRSTDEAAISAAVTELEKQVARLKGEELERASKRLQVLVVRRAQLRAKRERQERNQSGEAAGGGAGAGETQEFAIVDGRKVLVGGCGAVPLPSAATLRAPPEPEWPPQPARLVPPPPPRPPAGSAPPPLRAVPPPPISDVARARREMDREEEAKAREVAQRATAAAALAANPAMHDHPASEQRTGAGVLDALQRQLQQRHHDHR